MTRPVQFALAFGLMTGFVLPSETSAQCETYTVTFQDNEPHPAICLVPQQANGRADPHGACTMTVRENGVPKAGVQVMIDFTNCSSVRICQTQDTGIMVDCSGKKVWRNTDAQ